MWQYREIKEIVRMNSMGEEAKNDCFDCAMAKIFTVRTSVIARLNTKHL